MAVKRNGLGRNLSALLGASGSQALLTEKERQEEGEEADSRGM